MGPKIYSRIKTQDGRIPMLQTKYEVKLAKHNSKFINGLLGSFKIN